VITTAFWGKDKKFFSNHNSNEMVSNGVFLLQNQLMKFDDAVKAWSEYHEMSNKQLELLEDLYNQKIIKKEKKIILSNSDIQKIEAQSEDDLNESYISFEEIGILK